MRESTGPSAVRQVIVPTPVPGSPNLFTPSPPPNPTTNYFPQIRWDEVTRLARIMQGNYQRPGRLILRPMQSSIPDRLALAGSFLVAG